MGPMPPQGILLFGAQDVFIHAWDVAKTLDVPPRLSDKMIQVFTDTHHQSIDEQTRAMFFGPEIAVADDASAPNGRRFKEWATIPERDEALWEALASPVHLG